MGPLRGAQAPLACRGRRIPGSDGLGQVTRPLAGGHADLISLKAGGTGLNLTAANYVVLFAPWWHPAVEAQAIDRTHRIGQDRTVIAYRMVSQGTIEERIRELQDRKASLARDVLGEDGFAKALSRDDLDFLFADVGGDDDGE